MKAKFIALAALVLGLASCQTDVVDGVKVDANGEAPVTLQVGLPEDVTRAAGANSAKGAIGNISLENYDIRYILGVYDVNGNLAKRIEQFEDESTKTTFNLRLVPGRHYRFVVWADFVNEDTTVALHYDASDLKDVKLTKNMGDNQPMDESRDAYTGVFNTETDGNGKVFSSTSSINITLTRPFAKLRVVTNDMKELYSGLATATVTYNTPLYTSFNALTATPDELESNVVKNVDYSTMVYGNEPEPLKNGTQTLFADYFFGTEDGKVHFTLDVKDNAGFDIPQVAFNTDIPVQRNYLTTIMGPILTDPNTITVEIDEVFTNGDEWNPEDDKHDVDVWDGVSTKEPAYDDATKTYTVKCGAELAWIADQVNGVTRAGSNNFSGKTIKLAKNICLGGHEWTPIGGTGKWFAGTFDGCGYVVGDFQVTTQEGHAALFGNARATIKNLTVNNAVIVAHHYAGGIVGQGYCRIENCHVNGVDITLTTLNGDCGDKAGGIIGQNCEGGLYVKKSTAKNVKIQGYRDLGGIAGMAHNNNTVSDCSVENITILQDISVDYEKETPTTLGAVIGRKGNNVTDSGNTVGNGIEIAVIKAEGVTQNPDTEVYTVSSAEGLQNIVQIVEDDQEANIVLGGDIDLSQLVLTRATESNWTPIGTSEKPFTGTFDGRGYTIKNLALVEAEAKEGKAYIGFFGYAKDAEIKNVVFENVYINIPCLDIDHSQGHIGAVAGSLEGTSTIENVTVKGDIMVYATQTANGASRVAVVAGGNSYGNVTMKNVHVIANEGSSLIANNNTGALAGQLQGKMVFENCSSNINVTVNKFFAGGLVGIAAGDSYFENCHTTGDVAVVAGREGRHNDEYRVGGIAGGWADGKTKVCTLVNCSYTGKVSGKNADGAVAEPLDYAGYVGRGYTLSNCAGSTVIIDGMKYVQAYNDVYGVYYYNGAIMDVAGVKAAIFQTEDGFKAVSVAELNLNGMDWQDAMDWAAGLGEGWALASMEDLNAIYDIRCELNDALEADNAENALFWEGDELYVKNGSVYYALYMSRDEVPAGGVDANGNEYFANRVFFKIFNKLGYSDVLYSAFDCINKYAPLRDNYFARAVYTL